jgi:glutamate:GABA antiporter
MATVEAPQRQPGYLAVQEKAKLRKVLRRFDLVLFTACAIVGLDTVAFAASIGGEAITWLVGSLVLFLIPYGLLTAELGSTFPYEGGVYEWVKLAFGRLPGAITAILYWLSNPIWIGGTLSATAIAALQAFVFKGSISTLTEILIGLAFTWTTVAVAVMAFRYGKWGPNIGTIVKGAVVGIFFILVIAFLVSKGQPAGTVGGADFKPTISGFLGVIGVLVFLWVGFELSNGASEEMIDAKRDVPFMVLGSGAIAATLYGLTILGILLVIPEAGLSHVGGFADAYNRVASVLGNGESVLGPIFGILIVITLFGSGVVWLEGADRTQAVAALDGAAPAFMGKFTRVGTPLTVNVMSGLIGSAFVIFIFTFTKGSLADFFSVAIALAISTATLCYTFMMLTLPILRRKYPNVRRPYRVPGGLVGCWICSILSEAFVIVTGITLLWPGLIDGWFGQSYSMQDNWGVSRSFFEVVTLGTFCTMVLIGVLFWAVGRRNLRKGIAGESEVVAALAETERTEAAVASPGAGGPGTVSVPEAEPDATSGTARREIPRDPEQR